MDFNNIETAPMKSSHQSGGRVCTNTETHNSRDSFGSVRNDGKESPSHTHDVPPSSNGGDSTRHIRMSAEYAHALGYPLGCPIWYNFQSTSDAGLDFCTGFIKSAFMDVDTRKLIVEVESERTDDLDSSDVSKQTFHEDNISYATNCPVRVKIDQSTLDGEIVCAKPVFCNNGSIETIYYTVILFMGGNQRKVVDNVPAKSVRYREFEEIIVKTIKEAGDKSSVPAGTPKSSMLAPKKRPQSANSNGCGNEAAEEKIATSKAINALPQAAKVVLCIAVSLCQVWGPTAEISIITLKKYCIQASHHSLMDEWGLDNVSYLVETLADTGLLVTLADEQLNANDLNTKLKVGAQLKDVEIALDQKLLKPGCFYHRLIDYIRKECPYPRFRSLSHFNNIPYYSKTQ